MVPDTGGGDGGFSDPDPNVNLAEWVKKLEEAAKKDRPGIVEELAKILGKSVEDTWKNLHAAGWNPKGKKPPENTPPEPDDGDLHDVGEKPAGGKQTVTLRHKTTHSRYRRAGLVLSGDFKPYEVTEEQLAILKKDSWVEIGKK